MGYSNSYQPTYYSTLHDSITSLCKTILPFSFKKRSLTAADQKLSKLQSDNLKWQQDSFHQMLNLMGLHKEGILAEYEVSAFRLNLLDKLIASPPQQEQPLVLRDKLLFLQELLYAKCITEEEYHSSKRPLLQRLAVQGAEIEARDVIVAAPTSKDLNEKPEEEWSVIDLRDEKSLLKSNSNSKHKPKHHPSTLKHIKEAASVFGFVSSYKPGKTRKEKSIFDSASAKSELARFNENSLEENHFQGNGNETQSILMAESSPLRKDSSVKNAEKVKRKAFRTLFQREHSGNEGKLTQSGKKQWGYDGLKKWRSDDSDDETSPLPLNEKSHNVAAYWAADSDRNVEDSMDVVRKEFKKANVGEIERLRNAASEKQSRKSIQWTRFDDDEEENCHPNLFGNQDYLVPSKSFQNNPFLSYTNKKSESVVLQDENPFWTPHHSSSLLM